MLDVKKMGIVGEFPSPYGVSFILICDYISNFVIELNDGAMFPSPYGVSFILIENDI